VLYLPPHLLIDDHPNGCGTSGSLGAHPAVIAALKLPVVERRSSTEEARSTSFPIVPQVRFPKEVSFNQNYFNTTAIALDKFRQREFFATDILFESARVHTRRRLPRLPPTLEAKPA
jgi:hypothetical protein